MVSLRRRLTITHTLVALLAVLLVALLASGLISRAYSQLTEQQARNTRESLRNALAQYYRSQGSWEGALELLERRLESQPLLSRRRIILTDPSWQVLFDTRGVLERLRVALPLRLRPAAAPIMVGQQVVGYVAVPTGLDEQTDEERAFVRAIILISFTGSLLAGGLALLTALVVARRVTRPLSALTAAARRLAAGEQHQPLELPVERELAELALSFNRMAAELDRQADLRRQLVADIAHELRTPLSVLRLQIEALQDGVEQPTPDLIASLGEEAHLLTRLVDDLRLLSLADAGQLSLALADLEPRTLLERAATVALPRARQQGITLIVTPGSPLPDIRADPQRLAQVLGNLIENALRYTPRGGQVTLALRIEQPMLQATRSTTDQKLLPAPMVVFSVSDTGPGITPEDVPHIFDRFYRADRARSRETGGSGLGLAIAQRLVEAQHGRISVESTPGAGTTFAVWMPLSDPTQP